MNAPSDPIRLGFLSAVRAVRSFAASLKNARRVNAYDGPGLSISSAERAKRKRREKIAKASRKRNRR